ncbi:Type I secretion system, outer membrane component LapE [Olavius sp. associated proteobacterium Delta 1]|nr:Type I secretion system, outer membrane component LapE [Olavius sp. associated proteobacterium Delta 1]
MMSTRCYHRLLQFFAVGGLLLVAASCTLVEERIDRTAGGPNVPADTAVHMRLESSGQPEEIAAPKVPPGPLKVTITEAILLCLENNRSLVVQRLDPSIQQTFEDQERAVFDPAIYADVSAGRVKGERLERSGSGTEDFTTDGAEGIISLEQYFPTGTTVALEAGTQLNDASLYEDIFYTNRLGMTVTQALLRGYGTEVNLARLQQARLDTRMSEYELRGFTEFLVAEVERTYWDYALARRQIEIVEESLKVARQQLNETRELIAVGRLAKAELAAVQAEVALQEQALIEARTKKESMRLQLLRLLNPLGPGLWQREIDLIHQPTLPEIKLEVVELHVDVSMRMRPILNEARLEILRGDLELVRTQNGLLPLMDLFITLGKSGYANSFGESVRNIDKDSYDALAGVNFHYPVFNRDARARHQRALLSRDQAQKALENLSQLVEVDVRTAYIEVNRAKQQIAASSVTRMFDEQKLRTETEKLRVGKSTSFVVAQAQRDLLVSRIAEVRALASYLKALIDLYRQDGSLLERRGIVAPGREPTNLSAK